MIVRKLITRWGFEIDDKPLNNLEKRLGGIKSDLKRLAIIGGTAAAAIGFFAKRAGEIEQIEIAFETMTGSAEKANTLLQEITDFAKTTPFQLGGLFDASKSLLAFGFDAKEIIPTLDTLGNITAGVGTDKLPNLIFALGQVRAATKLTGQDLRQFTNAGVPLIGELAKHFGVAESAVKDMVAAGKVSFPDVQKALEGMTKEGGRFNNLMIRQSKSFLGIISNIFDTLDILRVEIGKELLPVVKEMAIEFLEFMEANRELIKVNLIRFMKELVIIARTIFNLFRNLFDIFARLGGGMSNLGETIRHIISLLITLMALRTGFFFLNLGKAAFIAGKQMRLFTIVSSLTGAALNLLSFRLGAAAISWRRFRRAMKVARIGVKLFKATLTFGLTLVLDDLIETMLGVEDTLTNRLMNAWPAMKDAAIDAWEKLSTFVTEKIDALQRKFAELKEGFLGALLAPGNKVANIAKFLAKTAAGAGSAIAGSVQSGLRMPDGSSPFNLNQPMMARAPMPSTGNTNNNARVSAPITINTPPGTSPDQVGPFVQQGVKDALASVLRSTQQQSEPLVEF